jgi:hypothetical protein
MKSGGKRKNTLTSVEEQNEEEADDDGAKKIQPGRTKFMKNAQNVEETK